LILVSAILIFASGMFLTSCDKDATQDVSVEGLQGRESTENNFAIQEQIFPLLDAKIIEAEVYSSLSFFEGTDCNTNMDIIDEYYKYKNITVQGSCDRNEIKEYYSILNNSTPNVAFDYLEKKGHISEEGRKIFVSIAKYLEEDNIDYCKFIDNSIKEVNSNILLSESERNKIIASLNITKFSLKYFEEKTDKSACSRCVWRNKGFIFGVGVGGGTIIGLFGCLPTGIAIVPCIIATTSFVTYMMLCESCGSFCSFCL